MPSVVYFTFFHVNPNYPSVPPFFLKVTVPIEQRDAFTSKNPYIVTARNFSLLCEISVQSIIIKGFLISAVILEKLKILKIPLLFYPPFPPSQKKFPPFRLPLPKTP